MASGFDLVKIDATAKLCEYLSRNFPNQYLLVGPTQHCMQGTASDHTRIGENDGKGPSEMPKVQCCTIP